MRFTGILAKAGALAFLAVAPAAAQVEAPADSPDGARPEAAATAAPARAGHGPRLGPEETALRAGLRLEAADLDPAERADILAFYEARGFAAFWAAPGAGRGETLVAALEAAGAHGLPPSRYDPAALGAALAGDGADAGGRAAAELAATRAYLRYARDLSSGVLNPARADEEINLRPVRPERPALLARLEATPLAQALAGLAPESPEYRALMEEKARLEEVALAADWGPVVPEGPVLKPGETEARVAALRARLTARGFGAPAAAGAAERFDGGLEAALRRFQTETGLDADGLAGPRTLAVLNEGPEARLSQIVVNLERLRWMNRDLGARHIYANIADYSVKLVEAGETVYASRTVVGKAVETRTPEFSEEMTYLVVNPTWHLPDSIAQRVYLPQLRQDPGVLAQNNMRLFTRGGTEIDPGLVDFSQMESGNFPFRIKQNPSAANALGRVKFMFPNQYSIYLHDTPLRDLFAREERAFSNGCVRVEDPLALAHLLLEGQVEDPQATFDGWLTAKAERYVNLARPIPVHLVYRTVFLDEAGALQYRLDVYGRDARVFAALQAAGVTLPAAQG